MKFKHVIDELADAFGVNTGHEDAAWRRFQLEWPEKMCRSADEAFIAYMLGQADREHFETARTMADRACVEGVSDFNWARRTRKNPRMPGWFKQRLARAMGPECFNHFRRDWDGHDSSWFWDAGEMRAYVPSLVKTPVGVETVYVDKLVFGFETLRPWVIDRQRLDVAAMRAAHVNTLDKLLEEPRRIAKHTRCDLVVQRAARCGWYRMRATFVPWDFEEPAELVPDDMVLNNCLCLRCKRRKVRQGSVA